MMEILYALCIMGYLMWLTYKAGKSVGRREKVEVVVDFVAKDQDVLVKTVKSQTRSKLFTENREN